MRGVAPCKDMSAWLLPLVLFLLPFEPRRPVIPLLGFEFTLLETVAGLAMGVLLWSCRGDAASLLRNPPVPLAFLWSYAAAHGLSATFAPAHRDLAAKFVLRMLASAAFALAVAAASMEARRRGLTALTVAASVVACLSILEGSGVRVIDPFLDLFRSGSFVVEGWRRASAGSENPNLAAAVLLYGFVSGIGILALSARPGRNAVLFSGLLSAGVLFTYSRGGLVATAIALGVLAFGLRRLSRSRAAAPAAALLVLLGASLTFAFASPAFRLRLNPEGLGYSARYEPRETALALATGETREVSVRVTNTGSRGWAADGETSIGCDWYDVRRVEFVRASQPAPFSRSVAPGDAVTMTVAVRAPDREGRFLLVWNVLRQSKWLSNSGVTAGVVPARVGGSEAAAPADFAATPPVVWRRGRAEMWRLALAMWRDRPFTGVGPDNFRWLHAEYGSWWSPSKDVASTSHNAFLEAAATTGTLGFLALLGTLVSVALAASARLQSEAAESAMAATLLALTVGMFTQAMVESFLGFTGHYLFLGFLVGSAALLGRPNARLGRLLVKS